jgi:hypothetical protein
MRKEKCGWQLNRNTVFMIQVREKLRNLLKIQQNVELHFLEMLGDKAGEGEEPEGSRGNSPGMKGGTNLS